MVAVVATRPPPSTTTGGGGTRTGRQEPVATEVATDPWKVGRRTVEAQWSRGRLARKGTAGAPGTAGIAGITYGIGETVGTIEIAGSIGIAEIVGIVGSIGNRETAASLGTGETGEIKETLGTTGILIPETPDSTRKAEIDDTPRIEGFNPTAARVRE